MPTWRRAAVIEGSVKLNGKAEVRFRFEAGGKAFVYARFERQPSATMIRRHQGKLGAILVDGGVP
jgi:hypothetical protein